MSFHYSIKSLEFFIILALYKCNYFYYNHKNSTFLDCDWFEKLLFSTNSLAKLLSDSLLSDNNQKRHSNCSLPISISERHETIYASFVSLFNSNFPFLL